MSDPVFFSLFEGVPDGPVTIFSKGQWTLDNQVELETCIIGKSHRVTSRGNGVSLTEFIACSSDEMIGKSLDHFPLQAGETYEREYQVGNINYSVGIEMVPRLFDDMEDFLGAMGEVPPMKILTHRFEAAKNSNSAKPFTGVAVDLAANRFLTIHTYPENELSIISKTSLHTPTGVTAS